jgi:hypothetical protein
LGLATDGRLAYSNGLAGSGSRTVWLSARFAPSPNPWGASEPLAWSGERVGRARQHPPEETRRGCCPPAPAPALTSGWEGEPSSSSRECLRAANRYAAASQCRKLHRLADSVLALIAHAVRPTGRRRPIRDSGSSRSEVQWCLGGHGLDTCGDNSVDALRAGLPRSGSASAGHPGWRST